MDCLRCSWVHMMDCLRCSWVHMMDCLRCSWVRMVCMMGLCRCSSCGRLVAHSFHVCYPSTTWIGILQEFLHAFSIELHGLILTSGGSESVIEHTKINIGCAT